MIAPDTRDQPAGRGMRREQLARTRATVRRYQLRIGPVIPAVILVILVLASLLAPVLTSFDPTKNDLPSSLLPPMWLHGGSGAHPLGTDSFGRDVLSRLLYGGRVTLAAAALSLVIATVLGTLFGLVAGYFGGAVGSVIMRFVEMVLSVPPLLIAIAVATAIGPSFKVMVTVVGLLTWPQMARLVRGETLAVRNREFVRYARAIGVPARKILLRHILPNVLPTILVVATLEVANVVLLTAALSFLGAGIPPPEPSWGGMISDGQTLIATGWWIALFPGLAIVLTVASLNMLGDWLRVRFDPRLKER